MSISAFEHAKNVDIARVLLDTYYLIRTHGLDCKEEPPEGTVPLRLHEAMKLAMGEHPRTSLIRMNLEQRQLFGAANWVLTARMEQFHPPYGVLTEWLAEEATTETVLALIENILFDHGVKP